jgi:hydroxysqualene synthase
MQGVSHYENFPVASWLCPAHLRPAVVALYHFARTADDLADEGQMTADERLSQLASYRDALAETVSFRPLAPHGKGAGAAPPCNPEPDPAWRPIFLALGEAVRQHDLPTAPLFHLLDAFEQDIHRTATGQRYQTLEELLDYCSRSANPVGRLLLHLYGVTDAESLRQSDALCTALQLINFWQDLAQDLARQRYYLPQDLLAQSGVLESRLERGAPLDPATDSAARALLQALCSDARERMLTGAPLACRIPGRAGWELRLVVQGGLRILEKIEFHHYRTWVHRPKLRSSDVPRMLWRACGMRPAPFAPAQL